jgi:hypothetical protein
MTGNQGFRVDPRGVVPRQNSGTFDFHLGNNVANFLRNSLIFKVARHFGEAQSAGTYERTPTMQSGRG